MEDIKALIAEKKAELESLQKSRPAVKCSSSHSSEQDVERESAIEDLEDEIRELEGKLTHMS